MPGAKESKSDNSRPRRSPASLLTESTHTSSSLYVQCIRTSACWLFSSWPVFLTPDLICSPVSTPWRPSPSLSSLPVCEFRPHSSHLDPSVGSWLASLLPAYVCLLSLIPHQTSPHQKELMCDHSLLFGNPAKVSAGSRMSPNQQALFLKIINGFFSPFFKDTFLYMDLHLYIYREKYKLLICRVVEEYTP